MTETAWAVSSGEYSDYRVHFVSLDEAIAREVAARLGFEVEALPLLTAVDQYLEHVSYHATAMVKPTGEIYHMADAKYRQIVAPYIRVMHRSGPGIANQPGDIYIDVAASAPAAARKAAKDYAAELAAEVVAGVPMAAVVAAFNARHQTAEEVR